jgi:hypothetical protein
MGWHQNDKEREAAAWVNFWEPIPAKRCTATG